MISSEKFVTEPFNLLYNDPVHTRVYLIDENGEKGEEVMAEETNAPITYATPKYVTDVLNFGDPTADWNDMWLDRERTTMEERDNPLVAINLKENVTGDLLGIELVYANSHSPFF